MCSSRTAIALVTACAVLGVAFVTAVLWPALPTVRQQKVAASLTACAVAYLLAGMWPGLFWPATWHRGALHAFVVSSAWWIVVLGALHAAARAAAGAAMAAGIVTVWAVLRATIEDCRHREHHAAARRARVQQQQRRRTPGSGIATEMRAARGRMALVEDSDKDEHE